MGDFPGRNGWRRSLLRLLRSADRHDRKAHGYNTRMATGTAAETQATGAIQYATAAVLT